MHSHVHHPHASEHHASAAGNGMGRAFAIGIALNVVFALAEWVLGVTANSLALVADATHNFSDVLGLLLAWGASVLARRPPSARFTYGLRGSTILAALTNAMILLAATGGIAWEALRRLNSTGAVNEQLVIWVAALGVVVNTATALLFLAQRKSDLNIRGAFLHMAADAGVSLGVVAAGIAMIYTGWTWLDPVISLMIVLVIFIGTWGMLRESLQLALHAAPTSVDPAAVRRYLEELPGVTEVHDLHVWAMSTTETALTAHLVMPGGHPGDAFFADAVHEIEEHFKIGHATLQTEIGTPAHPCVLAPDRVV